MHQIYDTVAKSGRNDLFESRLRLKTIGSASSYRVLIVVNSITRLNLKAVLEVYVTHYPPPPFRKNPPQKQDYILCISYRRQIVNKEQQWTNSNEVETLSTN